MTARAECYIWAEGATSPDEELVTWITTSPSCWATLSPANFRPAAEIVAKVFESMAAFRGHAAQTDDQTAVVVRILA